MLPNTFDFMELLVTSSELAEWNGPTKTFVTLCDIKKTLCDILWFVMIFLNFLWHFCKFCFIAWHPLSWQRARSAPTENMSHILWLLTFFVTLSELAERVEWDSWKYFTHFFTFWFLFLKFYCPWLYRNFIWTDRGNGVVGQLKICHNFFYFMMFFYSIF